MNRRDFFNTAVVAGALSSASAKERVTASVGRLGIASVEPIVVGRTTGIGAWVFVRIRTDQGLEGIGECYPWTGAKGMPEAVRGMGVRIIAADARDIQQIVSRLAPQGFRDSFGDTRPGCAREAYAALSGIEIALWDLLGKAVGLPVHALLGGKVRDRILLYANHRTFLYGAKTMEERIERALQAKANGYRIFKWDPTPYYGPRGKNDIGKVLHEIAAFRKALGDDFGLAIDCHNNLTYEAGVTLARELEGLKILFWEAPLLWEDGVTGKSACELYQRLAEITSVPIADGEWLCTRGELKEVLDRARIRIYQPEVTTNGGILETFRAGALAEAYGASVSAHHWCGPVAVCATAHVCSALPNLHYEEFGGAAPEAAWEAEVIEPPNRIERGELVVPDRPGLGFRLNEKLLAKRRIA
jgi:galactonate dehydratase